ncbi:MAG: tetratricopeptide repeat protein [Deltaproteobacteria bacterium]|nr:tetratricopeptide repeat protein [Deltaproteobacteria bacterium]
MTESLDARDDAVTRTATSHGGCAVPVVPVAATSIGRFAVLGAVGAGGMGQVFSAYDPQLDRRVALKLLHGHADAVERARLVREAQALARLTHPNVVAVYEVGSHEGHVFVAMEFVEGTTLREWMDAHAAAEGTTDSRVRALEILLDAGRGIQAAHAAGLVHRDVKPRNILVGNDGRVRVVDFGLARSGLGEPEELTATARTDAPEPLDASHADGTGTGTLLATALTQTGKVVGTPAYMAPEQFQPGPVDPSADQFAFCVTAWEVLFGARPFGGTTVAMLLAIRAGNIERPSGIEVPPALEAALRRGLSHRPSRRHPDMATLLDVFEQQLARLRGEPPPRRGSRRVWWIAGSVGVIATAGAFWLGGRDVVHCDGAEERFVGVWDATRKADIRTAVLGTGAGFADGTWARLETSVDGWRAAWEAGHRDACEATRTRGEQSERLMDLRIACLDSRRQRLVAYLDLLASPSVEVLAGAEEGFATLPPIERCADLEYVQRRGQRSEDPELAKMEDEVLAEVARASSLQAAGDFEGALAIADAAVVRSEGSELARAHALLAKGRALASVRPREATVLLEEAYGLARATDVAEVAAGAAFELIDAHGLGLEAASEAKLWLGIARAEAERLGDPMQLTRVDVREGVLLTSLGETEGAEQALARAFEALETSVDDTAIEYAKALQVRSVLPGAGQAVADATAALDIMIGALGPNHPGLAAYHRSMARALVGEGELDAALEHAQRGVEISETAFGPNSERLAPDLLRRSEVENLRSGSARSLATIGRALALDYKGTGPLPTVAKLRRKQGAFLMELGDFDAAMAAFRESYRIHRELHGERHPSTAHVMIELGTAERKNGMQSEGSTHIRVGVALAEELLGTQHPAVLEILDRLGAEAQDEGRFQDAYDWSLRTRSRARQASRRADDRQFAAEVNLCEAAHGLGRTELAISHCRAAIDIAASARMRNPSHLAHVQNNLGAALLSAERYDEALQCFERAQALWSIQPGPASMFVAMAIANIAEIHQKKGLNGDSRRLYRRSLEMREALNGNRHSSLVTPLLGISTASLSLGDRAEAVRTAERALRIAEDPGSDPRLLARASEALALALDQRPSSRSDRTRSRLLMERALETFEPIGPGSVADVNRVRTWLDEN